MRIDELKKDLLDLGLEENLYLGVLIYLTATARKTENKISVLVSGPAGLGKSHVVNSILGLFPDEDIISFSRITPAGLLTLEDLRHKILYIYEKFRDPQYSQYIRELITEGEVRYMTADGERCLKGPTTVVETTVNADVIGIENKSRCFSAGINKTTEARTRILERQRTDRTIQGLQQERALEALRAKHKTFQQGLKHIRVVIPFAEDIKFQCPSHHAARAQERLLNVICAIAFMDQQNRRKKAFEETIFIEARETDFEEVKEILTHIPIDENESMIPPQVAEFVNLIRVHKENLCRKPCFTRNDMLEVLPSDNVYRNYKAIVKILKVLSEFGFINEKPVRGIKNRAEYSFSNYFPKLPMNSSDLTCYASISLAQFCHR